MLYIDDELLHILCAELIINKIKNYENLNHSDLNAIKIILERIVKNGRKRFK